MQSYDPFVTKTHDLFHGSQDFTRSGHQAVSYSGNSKMPKKTFSTNWGNGSRCWSVLCYVSRPLSDDVRLHGMLPIVSWSVSWLGSRMWKVVSKTLTLRLWKSFKDNWALVSYGHTPVSSNTSFKRWFSPTHWISEDWPFMPPQYGFLPLVIWKRYYFLAQYSAYLTGLRCLLEAGIRILPSSFQHQPRFSDELLLCSSGCRSTYFPLI